MRIRKKVTVLFILFLAVIFLLPELASAQDVLGVNDLANGGVNLGTRDLKETIARVVNIALGFLGILATLIILYGGFTWMTSGGSPDKIDRAKKIIINAAIGLVVILTSYAVVRFILTGGGTGVFIAVGPGPSGYVGGAGLSTGVLKDHYPVPGARDIPRNTNIYISFKEDIDVATIVEDYNDCVNNLLGVDCPANTTLINLVDTNTGANITGNDLLVTFDLANLTVFEFDPVNNLGLDNEDVKHRMDLGNLQTANSEAVFPIDLGYSWEFTVSTEIDLTPPSVVSVLPPNGSAGNPLNSVVQINFSEAVNPMNAVGVYDDTNGVGPDDFTNIMVADIGVAPSAMVNGQYLISNQYKTVEFITDDLCGQNSCGGDVYCLPASTDIAGEVTINITDMAGNTLDCANPDPANCNAANSYSWSFGVGATMDLTPPNIVSMQNVDNILVDAPIEINFSENLLSSSVDRYNVGLTHPTLPVNYWVGLNGSDVIYIDHPTLESQEVYTPFINSGVQDTQQNCWYECECGPAGICHCSNNTIGTNCPTGADGQGHGSHCGSDI